MAFINAQISGRVDFRNTTNIDVKTPSFAVKICAIAANTFREAVRDRVLYNLVLFVLLIVAAAILLGDLTDGQEARTIVNFGLSAMLIFGAFIAIFVGVGLVSKEIEKRTVFAIFSKPVARSEFLLGKYLGLCLTLLINVIVMGAGVSLALVYVGSAELAASIWATVYLIFLELTIITAVAILFSTFSSPTLSAFLTFLIFVVGHFSQSLREFAGAIGTTFAKVLFTALYYLLPNLAYFNFITPAARGIVPSLAFAVGATAYSVVYATIVLTTAIAIFSRRNFK